MSFKVEAMNRRRNWRRRIPSQNQQTHLKWISFVSIVNSKVWYWFGFCLPTSKLWREYDIRISIAPQQECILSSSLLHFTEQKVIKYIWSGRKRRGKVYLQMQDISVLLFSYNCKLLQSTFSFLFLLHSILKTETSNGK